MLTKLELLLIQKLVKGDKTAFKKFYQQTHFKLLTWINHKVKNSQDAEEIIQDTYLAFLDSLPLFQGKSSIFTFLLSIARHEIADYWRKCYAKRAVLTIPFAEQVYTEKLYSSIQTRAIIEQIFIQMIPDQVKILRYKYEQGLTVIEIATRIGISVKAVESKLFRARKAFQLLYLTNQSLARK